MAATEAQLANLAKARAKRAEKRAAVEVGDPTGTIVVSADFPRVAGNYDASVEAMILTMREQLNNLADKVELLWLERENATTARRLHEPYKIPYRCAECNTVVEDLHPRWRVGTIRCPNPIHGGGLTVMEFTP